MTKNQIVSHNLEILLNSLSEETYQDFLAEVYRQGTYDDLAEEAWTWPAQVLCIAFSWGRSVLGRDHWSLVATVANYQAKGIRP